LLDRSNSVGVALASGVHLADAGSSYDVADVVRPDAPTGENFESSVRAFDE
jgi:hypothetical protein